MALLQNNFGLELQRAANTILVRFAEVIGS